MLYCLCMCQDMSISDINVSLGAAMALHEELSGQMQRKWLSRLARERRDLSASVEATLLDTVWMWARTVLFAVTAKVPTC